MSKYAPLQQHLESTNPEPVSMSFDAIADIVGGLPTSAFRYRAWWANDWTHPNAVAWMNAGRQVTGVNLSVRRVHFSAKVGSGHRR